MDRFGPPDHVIEQEPEYIDLWQRAVAVLYKNWMQYEEPEKVKAVVASTNPSCLEDSWLEPH
jgi:hypothetical protein